MGAAEPTVAIGLTPEDSHGERKTIALRERGALLIPRGTWHFARVREPSEMWFVTVGEGTQHRGV